jgi:hypothetical protein
LFDRPPAVEAIPVAQVVELLLRAVRLQDAMRRDAMRYGAVFGSKGVSAAQSMDSTDRVLNKGKRLCALSRGGQQKKKDEESNTVACLLKSPVR